MISFTCEYILFQQAVIEDSKLIHNSQVDVSRISCSNIWVLLLQMYINKFYVLSSMLIESVFSIGAMRKEI